MPCYFLDYVDADGGRVANITNGKFENLADAEQEALKIISEFLGGGEPSPMLGHIEVVDEAGAPVTEVPFAKPA